MTGILVGIGVPAYFLAGALFAHLYNRHHPPANLLDAMDAGDIGAALFAAWPLVAVLWWVVFPLVYGDRRP